MWVSKEELPSLSGRLRACHSRRVRAWYGDDEGEGKVCSESHRLFAYRRGAHGFVQLALCPAYGRNIHFTDRGHGCGAQFAGSGRCDSEWIAVARIGLG